MTYLNLWILPEVSCLGMLIRAYTSSCFLIVSKLDVCRLTGRMFDRRVFNSNPMIGYKLQLFNFHSLIRVVGGWFFKNIRIERLFKFFVDLKQILCFMNTFI